MPFQTHSVALQTSPLELRLGGHARLSSADLTVIRACAEDVRTHAPGADILAGAGHARLIMDGWAGWMATLPDGRRQIMQILVAGDLIGYPVLTGGSVAALTTLKTVDATPLVVALEEPASEFRGLRAAWAGAQQAIQRQLLDQVVRLGRRSAYERTAHLMCELLERQQRAGIAERNAMPWPLTQEMLADVLGLSIVHVNRTLQQLRRDGVIVLRTGRVTVPDVARLAHIAGWEDGR